MEEGETCGGENVGDTHGSWTLLGAGGGATARAKAGTVLLEWEELVPRLERYPRPDAWGGVDLTAGDDICAGLRTELDEDEDGPWSFILNEVECPTTRL